MGAADSLNVAGFASVDACAGAASGVAERAAGDLSSVLAVSLSAEEKVKHLRQRGRGCSGSFLHSRATKLFFLASMARIII